MTLPFLFLLSSNRASCCLRNTFQYTICPIYDSFFLLSKVDIVKGEVERQRLEREELEMELDAVKQQMNNVKKGDTDIRRLKGII